MTRKYQGPVGGSGELPESTGSQHAESAASPAPGIAMTADWVGGHRKDGRRPGGTPRGQLQRWPAARTRAELARAARANRTRREWSLKLVITLVPPHPGAEGQRQRCKHHQDPCEAPQDRLHGTYP